MRLLLIRHAHAGHNSGAGAARLVGNWDEPLSGEGREQLPRLRERLSALSGAAAYTSPLRRAKETADAVLARTACPCPLLREIDCGRCEGAELCAIERSYPELWRRHLLQIDDDFRWPGGESYRELRARALRAVRTIAARHSGETVLLFTHAGVIGQIAGWVLGSRPGRWSEHRPGNASITEIEWAGARARLLRFNDESHLIRPGLAG